jgi:hypothetical protein
MSEGTEGIDRCFVSYFETKSESESEEVFLWMQCRKRRQEERSEARRRKVLSQSDVVFFPFSLSRKCAV